MPKLTNRTTAEVPPATKLQLQDLFTKVLNSLDSIIDKPTSQSYEEESPNEHCMMSLSEPDDLSVVFESASFSIDTLNDVEQDIPAGFSQSFAESQPDVFKSRRKKRVNDLLSQVEEPQTLYKVVLKTSLEKHNPPKDLQEFLRNLTR